MKRQNETSSRNATRTRQERHSTVIASAGHASAQAPQLAQSSLTHALSSLISIAPQGQASAQAPQPTQTSLSTLAAIIFSFIGKAHKTASAPSPRLRGSTSDERNGDTHNDDNRRRRNSRPNADQDYDNRRFQENQALFSLFPVIFPLVSSFLTHVSLR